MGPTTRRGLRRTRSLPRTFSGRRSIWSTSFDKLDRALRMDGRKEDAEAARTLYARFSRTEGMDVTKH